MFRVMHLQELKPFLPYLETVFNVLRLIPVERNGCLTPPVVIQHSVGKENFARPVHYLVSDSVVFIDPPHRILHAFKQRTVVDFVQYAKQKIAEIRERGHFPIIAGGTGLYVDALVYDYQFNDVVKKTYSDREAMNEGYLVVGIDWPRGVLRDRLLQRSYKLFEQPIEEETLKMVEKYGWDEQAMKSDIYPICWELMRGNISLDEAIKLNAVDDWHLAKRQLTWFKRNKNIIWLPLDGAKERISNFYLSR